MVLHHQAVKNLGTEDYLVIAKEHALLEKFLDDLRDACACCKLGEQVNCTTCDAEMRASCQGRLPSFLYYVIDLAAKHFDHEEKIMLSRPHVTKDYEYFRVHHQAHVEIMQKLNALIDQCFSLDENTDTGSVYRQFHQALSELFNQHDHAFDDPFIESTKT
jgi:hemerythrin